MAWLGTPAPAQEFTVESLKAAYPGLSQHAVSPEEFKALTQSPRQVAQVVIPAPPAASTTNAIHASTTNAPPLPAPRPAAYSRSLDGFYLSDFGSVDSEGAAIVVFVVAGLVVVSAAIIYSGALLANVWLRPEEAEVWGDIGPRAMFFSGGHQQGYMTGATLALGLAGDGADVGLVLEGGYLKADVLTVTGNEVEVAGGYGMAGLTIRWPFDSGTDASVIEAELLAGNASNYNLISRAGFALTWSVAGPWRAGLRLGALYLDVEETDGPAWEAGEDFNLLGGVETSLRF